MMEQLGIINFPAFLAAGILLNLTPGSDTMYILARSLSQGRRAGILSALGISTGAVFHTLAAVCGLSVILANSAVAFQLVKYMGAAYLIYLGIRAFISGNTAQCSSIGGESSARSSKEIFFSGVLTNVLNPKVALFFLAFLPQFISADTANASLAFLLLGCTFITTGTVWCLCLACFSSIIRQRLKSGGRFLHRLTGTIFLLLGLKLAFSHR